MSCECGGPGDTTRRPGVSGCDAGHGLAGVMPVCGPVGFVRTPQRAAVAGWWSAVEQAPSVPSERAQPVCAASAAPPAIVLRPASLSHVRPDSSSRMSASAFSLWTVGFRATRQAHLALWAL